MLSLPFPVTPRASSSPTHPSNRSATTTCPCSRGNSETIARQVAVLRAASRNGGSSRSRFSSEFLFQFGIGELDHRRGTVRAGVRQLALMELLQQGAQFLAAQRLARLHRMTAHGRGDLVLTQSPRMDFFACLP